MESKPKIKLILVAALAVISAAVVNGKAVPIYDGIGNPDEPYRYVQAPNLKAAQTSPPTEAAGLYNTSDLTNINRIYAASNEIGPQVAINLGQNSFILPPNAKTVDIKVEPLAPIVQPKDGTIAGNVYRLTITSDAGAVKFSPASSNDYRYIDLRLPQGSPANPVIEYRPQDGSWLRLDTGQVGNDIYEAPIEGQGDFAMVIPKSVSGKISHQRKTRAALIIGAAAFCAVMAATVLAIRSNSRKGRK